MARYRRTSRGRSQVWEYYIWPLGIGTPHWWDNNHQEYRTRGGWWVDRVYDLLSSWGFIRHRCAECHLSSWDCAQLIHHSCGWPADPRRSDEETRLKYMRRPEPRR